MIPEFQIGEVYRSATGKRWRVVCKSDGGTLGLVPVGVFHRLKWWLRGVRFP